MSPRANALLLLLILIPVGFGIKFYPGPGRELFNNSIAGALYVIFWALPSLPPWKNVVMVCTITSIFEVLQLWHPDFLETTRSTFPGRTILGTTFAPMDFFST